jgi:hypothetical protein
MGCYYITCTIRIENRNATKKAILLHRIEYKDDIYNKERLIND